MTTWKSGVYHSLHMWHVCIEIWVGSQDQSNCYFIFDTFLYHSSLTERCLLTEEAATEHDGIERDEDGPNFCSVENIIRHFGIVTRQGFDTRVAAVQWIHYVTRSITVIITNFTRRFSCPNVSLRIATQLPPVHTKTWHSLNAYRHVLTNPVY